MQFERGAGQQNCTSLSNRVRELLAQGMVITDIKLTTDARAYRCDVDLLRCHFGHHVDIMCTITYESPSTDSGVKAGSGITVGPSSRLTSSYTGSGITTHYSGMSGGYTG